MGNTGSYTVTVTGISYQDLSSTELEGGKMLPKFLNLSFGKL